jgi:collagenase-like PrtC family protease
MSNPPPSNLPELLAPAGDRAALDAALEAGATAVYFGLTTLNARRRARNFRQEEFPAAVEAVHAHGARAYLTLNTDLADRELGQAARILELARQSKVDAVLVRDPALLALKHHYPELEFHFSTQTCMANSLDVAAAGQLGASRVVLAREMTLAEIATASAASKVQTEVFVQGALCFSISGRCLLSSWVGGRSGNRGACTSPCRVPWTREGEPVGTALSMHDLVTVHRLQDLRAAGVAALKIEGRLKTAEWVGKAVRLYRRGLEGEASENLLAEAAELGAYTGRAMTSGYLDAQRNDLTGVARRERSQPAADELPADADADDAPAELADDIGPSYDFHLDVGQRAIACRLECAGQTYEWTIPKTVVRRPEKALSVDRLFQFLEQSPIRNHQLGRGSTNDPEYLLVPRAGNALVDRISNSIRLALKAPDNQVRVELPEAVENLLDKAKPSVDNVRRLGERPDRVRLDARAVGEFLRQAQPGAVIVEGLVAGQLEKTAATCGDVPLVVALPAVFFEDEVANLRRLVELCREMDLPVEVNSWGGWRLAREAHVRIESGPGLPVLNWLAARTLGRQGIDFVTLSPEADRRQLEEVTAHCPVPCSLIVFGRPPLATTRVEIDSSLAGQVLEDRRGLRVVPRRERGLWVFRPEQPFDLRGLENQAIHVCHLVVDLVGSPDPVGEWQQGSWDAERAFRFNYDRTLA